VLSGLARAVGQLDLGGLASARWFAGKGRRPVAMTLVDGFPVPDGDSAWLAVVDVRYEDGGSERYALPGRLSRGRFVEVGAEDVLWPALARATADGVSVGAFVAEPGSRDVTPEGPGRRLTDDQSNTSVVLGDSLVVKCYRRLLPGTHPEPEVLAGLSRVGSRRAPRFGGSLTRRSSEGAEALVCAYSFVPGEPVGWEGLIVRVRHAIAASDSAALDALAGEMGALGAATAELHVDLVRAFGVTSATADDAHTAVEQGRARLVEAGAVASGDLARAVDASRDGLLDLLGDLRLLEGTFLTRCHGDLHVGQFVDGPDGLVVVDFEGEPGRPLEARRSPGTPLRDLACLLLSFDHVAVAAARRLSFGGALDLALEWSARGRAGALEAYRLGIAESSLTLDERLLQALEAEKECHEVVYAATVLPEWSYAPALVLPRVAARSGGPA
jgi:maltokinase